MICIGLFMAVMMYSLILIHGERLPLWGTLVCFGAYMVFYVMASFTESSLRDRVKKLEEKLEEKK